MIDIFALAGYRSRQVEEALQLVVEGLPQTPWIGLTTQRVQLVLLRSVEQVSSHESGQGSLRQIKSSFVAGGAVRAGLQGLLGQAHDRLEEVVIEPHVVVQPIESLSLQHRVEALGAQVSPDQGGILLLDEAVVVLVVRAATRQLHLLDPFAPEADQVGVEELAAVVRMDFPDGEG